MSLKNSLAKAMESKEVKSGILFTIFTYAYFGVFVFFGLYILFMANENWQTFLSFSSYSIATIIVLLIYKKNNKEEKILLKKFNPKYLLFSFLLAFGMMFGFGFINSAFANAMEKLGANISTTTLDLSSFPKYILCVLTFSLAPAIFEEITFRHLILKGIKGNIIIGSLLSALCFALYHLSLSQLIYQFIYGFFLSVLAIKSGSIIPSILAHFLNNFIVITLEYFKININLYCPWIILIGLFLMAIFTFFTLIYKREKKDEKVKVIPFILGASFGLITCISIMVGVSFG